MADHFKSCSVEGCNGNAARNAGGRKGWCWSHYTRWKRYGAVDAGPTRRTSCAVPNCDNGGRLKLGFCNKHYIRFKKYGSPNKTLISEQGAALRFIEELVSQGNWPEECIKWPFGEHEGYGSVKVDGVTTGAHREICRRVHGEPPTAKHEVRHLCGKGAEGCVNPAHLVWGTHAENMADLVRHGTKVPARGGRQWKAKLSADDVKQIRLALASGETQASIADRFGVTEPSINAIHRGRTWAWLK